MSAPFVGTYRISVRSEAEARALAATLAVEAGDPLPKATVRVAPEAREVVIRVEAEDASALRAASKSFLSWAKGALQSARVAAPSGGRGASR